FKASYIPASPSQGLLGPTSGRRYYLSLGRTLSLSDNDRSFSHLEIDYRHTTAEALAEAGELFDVVLNMEVVEHVADPLAYLTACRQLLKPGGLHLCSTINRNAKSFAMAIVGAEWVMRWLPKGTHEWSKFITPDELCELMRKAGLDPVDRKGYVFNPVSWSWSISDRDLSVNYVTAAINPEPAA
uniref:bifunctional 2-polyprenyl-6-hydroxyphenol methylase/3-demethylubiquinol 3-O-methyltransferase UbiG n=1 Tax=uncultured Salipiger sp. TaxID=499810 RepID=UPI0025992CD4